MGSVTTGSRPGSTASATSTSPPSSTGRVDVVPRPSPDALRGASVAGARRVGVAASPRDSAGAGRRARGASSRASWVAANLGCPRTAIVKPDLVFICGSRSLRGFTITYRGPGGAGSSSLRKPRLAAITKGGLGALGPWSGRAVLLVTRERPLAPWIPCGACLLVAVSRCPGISRWSGEPRVPLVRAPAQHLLRSRAPGSSPTRSCAVHATRAHHEEARDAGPALPRRRRPGGARTESQVVVQERVPEEPAALRFHREIPGSAIPATRSTPHHGIQGASGRSRVNQKNSATTTSGPSAPRTPFVIAARRGLRRRGRARAARRRGT